jgi:hypothetical protein
MPHNAPPTAQRRSVTETPSKPEVYDTVRAYFAEWSTR